MKRLLVSALLCSAVVAASITASTAQTQTQTLPSAPAQSQDVNSTAKAVTCPPEYKLQPGDVMKIKIWNEPDLSGENIIDPKGYINLAFLGQTYAEGFTQRELVDNMRAALSKYLVEPKIELTMLQFHKLQVYVLGQVNRPGEQEIQLGDQLMKAIAGAGSFTDDAKLNSATLTHKGSQESVPIDLEKIFYDGDMSKNLVLQDGDTIYIPLDTMNKYFVLGEVARPGMFRFRKGTTVIDAVSTAGGPTDRGNLKSTYIVRGSPTSPERIPVDMRKLVKSADMTQNVALNPGDVVYVSKTTKPDWSKISQILSAMVNTTYLFR